MSGYQVLYQASDALRDMLFGALVADITPKPTDKKTAVILAPPPEKSTGGANTLLSLWLYLVTENEHLKNRPNTVEPSGVIRPPPLGLTLYYLLAPGNGVLDTEAAVLTSTEVLGVVLETIHSTPTLPLIRAASRDETEAREELHLSLCRMGVEELAQIWQALERPYRLSVCLKVNVVRIDSARSTVGKFVRERQFVAGRLQPASTG